MIKVRDRLQSALIRHRGLGVNFSLNLFFRIIAILATIFSGIVLTRAVGKSGRGVFQMVHTSLAILNALFSFGLNSSAIYYANKYKEAFKGFVSNAIWTIFLSSLLVTLGLFLFGNSFRFQSDSLRTLFVICYIFYSFQLIMRSALMGRTENVFMYKLDAYLRTGSLFFVMTLSFFNRLTVEILTILLIVEYILFSYFSKLHLRVEIWPFRVDQEQFKESFYFNIKSYIIGLLTILMTRGDQYLIKFMMGNESVGYYGVGNGIIESLGTATSILMTIYLPRFMEISDLELKLKKIQKLIVWTTMLSAAIAILFYGLAPLILTLYYKSPQPMAAKSLRILLLGFVVYTPFVILIAAATSMRFRKSTILIIAFCLVLNLSINYLLIPRYGFIASAWISVATYMLLSVMTYIDLFYFKRKNHRRNAKVHEPL